MPALQDVARMKLMVRIAGQVTHTLVLQGLDWSTINLLSTEMLGKPGSA